jgi:hypothetical protein
VAIHHMRTCEILLQFLSPPDLHELR